MTKIRCFALRSKLSRSGVPGERCSRTAPEATAIRSEAEGGWSRDAHGSWYCDSHGHLRYHRAPDQKIDALDQKSAG